MRKMMSEDMPWVLGLTDEEIQELRTNKQQLTEYGKQKIRKLMNKKPTLWEIMRDQLGFSIDMCDEIVDAVEEWLPPEHDTNSYKWNQCIRMIREKLR
jgi:hypothetical protein